MHVLRLLLLLPAPLRKFSNKQQDAHATLQQVEQQDVCEYQRWQLVQVLQGDGRQPHAL